jgi:D-xylose transport system ATP-binding protein
MLCKAYAVTCGSQGEIQSVATQTAPSEPSTKPIFEMVGVNKSFGPVHVLHDVDFRVFPGQVTALVGDNGAGKSTLIKCITGIYTIDTGSTTFEDRAVSIHGPKDAAALGIEVVYQDLALCDNLDITQNMFLGRESKALGLLDERTMERKARETLASLSVRTVKSVRTSVSALSGGQRQTVAIAKAVLWNSKVVMLDEPTAALGVSQTRQVLDLVRRLADNGLGVVLISHNMNDVLEVADRVCAMYLGRVAADVSMQELRPADADETIARLGQGCGRGERPDAETACGSHHIGP